MLSGPCNSKEITHDVEGSANDECADVNPGALHVMMTNFLGINQLPLVQDRSARAWRSGCSGRSSPWF